jgi:hypothetical protein
VLPIWDKRNVDYWNGCEPWIQWLVLNFYEFEGLTSKGERVFIAWAWKCWDISRNETETGNEFRTGGRVDKF